MLHDVEDGEPDTVCMHACMGKASSRVFAFLRHIIWAYGHCACVCVCVCGWVIVSRGAFIKLISSVQLVLYDMSVGWQSPASVH